MKLIENKNVLITGASRGIGRCTALLLAQHGANIAFTDLREDENSASLIEEITALGVKAKFYANNAADYEAVQQLVAQVNADFGSIDVLVNNAGITKDDLRIKMTPEQWDAVINVNLRSVFCMCKEVVPIMMRQRSGSIINISSIVGLQGNYGQSNYAASKAGIIGFTRSIAKEYGKRNIRVNAVAPGFIETPMTATLPEDIVKGWQQQIPLVRFGKADDVANTVLYLASELSSYVTGHVISCDGGMAGAN